MSEEIAECVGTAMRLDMFTWESYIPGCKFVANVSFPFRVLGGTFPESTIHNVVGGLERNARYMQDTNPSSALVPTGNVYSYLDDRELGVLADVSALVAFVLSPNNIKVVFDAGGVHALLMVLIYHKDDVHVCELTCLVLTRLAPDKGVF